MTHHLNVVQDAALGIASASGFNLTINSGSCGYGNIDPRLYPFYNVVGLSPNNSIVKTRPQAACGNCLEILCDDPRVKDGICYGFDAGCLIADHTLQAGLLITA